VVEFRVPFPRGATRIILVEVCHFLELPGRTGPAKYALTRSVDFEGRFHPVDVTGTSQQSEVSPNFGLEELLFVLGQEFDSYQGYQKKMTECDDKLYEQLRRMEQKADPKTLPECERNKRPHGNVPKKFDLREELYRIVGVDLTSIDGINGLTAQTVIAEVGYDMSRWATEGSFTSWLNLAPNNKISGGKVIGRDKRKVVNRAGQALRQAASTLLRSQSYLGAQYRRLRAKLGNPKAVKAMAGKLARLIYRGLKYGQVYVDKGSEFYEQKYRQQQIKILTKKATELGLQVVDPA